MKRKKQVINRKVTNSLKVNKKKYILLIIFTSLGIFLTASLFLLLIDCINNCKIWNIFVSIISSIGIGIFSSSLIALFIEKKQNNIEQNRKEELINYFFLRLKNQTKSILDEQIYITERYLSLNNNENIKTIYTDLTIKESMQKIVENINKIEDLNNKNLKKTSIDGKIVFNKEIIERIKKEDDVICQESLGYYEMLFDSIIYILNNEMLFIINHLLEKEDSIKLKATKDIINDIIRYSKSNNKEMVITLEKTFYKKHIPELLKVLKISNEETLEI